MSSSVLAPRSGSVQRGVGVGRQSEAEVGAHVAHLADAGPRRPARAAGARAGVHRIHIASIRNSPRSRAAATIRSDSAARDAERLLAEHRLAGLERGQHVRLVEGVRGGDVDDVDAGIGQQGGVRAVRRPAPCRAANASADRLAAASPPRRSRRRAAVPRGRGRSCPRCRRWRGSPTGSGTGAR